MKSLASLIFCVITTTLFSQNALDLQPGPSDGNDARIFNMDALGNFGNDVDLIASQLDYAGEPGTTRSVIKFDLTGLPKGVTVTDARLSLYYNHESSTPGQIGDNAAYLRRLLVSWDESTVAWAQQPVYTNENEVLIPASTIPTQDYIDINVTGLVNDMAQHNNYGFMFMLQNEEGVGKSMKFYSSDGAIAEKRPRLVVVYSMSSAIDDIRFEHVASYPNPFDHSIAIEGLSGINEVYITGPDGKTIQAAHVENNDDHVIINQLENLTPGLYFFRMVSDEKIYLSKAIKLNSDSR